MTSLTIIAVGNLKEDYLRDGIAEYKKRISAYANCELKELKEEAGDEESSLVRKAFFRTIMSFTRQMMIGGRLEYYQSFRNIEAVEEAYRQCDRSMNEEAVLSFMIDRMVFP